jgi:hypothetical protein
MSKAYDTFAGGRKMAGEGISDAGLVPVVHQAGNWLLDRP